MSEGRKKKDQQNIRKGSAFQIVPPTFESKVDWTANLEKVNRDLTEANKRRRQEQLKRDKVQEGIFTELRTISTESRVAVIVAVASFIAIVITLLFTLGVFR
jgi:hypothetical protein